MKKILSVALAMLMLVAFVGCGSKNDATPPSTEATTSTNEDVAPATLKFGTGIDAQYGAATSATEDANGSGEVIVNVAAVLVDNDGKIVKCEIDTADFTCEFTPAGEAVVDGEYKTKYELGDAYGMKAYGGSAKEWFEQVDAFEAVCVGKTIDEVKALLVDGYKGNDEVVSAGCTIGIAEFVVAVEKAVNNAADSAATADATLSIGISTAVDSVPATEDAEGSVEFEINVVCAAMNDGKVVCMDTDVVSAAFAFDAKGVAAEVTGEIVTKKAAGTSYGMSSYGVDLNGDGVVKEWFEQAAVFNAECVGKTADEIAALAVDGYGVESLQTAGCTIAVSDMVNAAVKAAK